MPTRPRFPVTTFRTPRHGYLYDAATQHIARLPEPAFEVAQEAFGDGDGGTAGRARGGLTLDERAAGERFLAALRDQAGVALPVRPRRVVSGYDDRTARDRDALWSLLLAVTGRCNLRCGYCVYGGGYPGRRRHGAARMPWSVARRAIGYLAEHSAHAGRDERMLGWYGGEPFLHLPLLERSAAELGRVFAGHPAIFHVTSNATAWSDRALDFLAGNDVRLLVSLDGPAEVHDANRRFAGGRPSHAAVMAGLERLEARHPDYFARRVGLNAVLAPPVDLVVLDRFFAALGLPLVVSAVEPTAIPPPGAPPPEITGAAALRARFVEGCRSGVFAGGSFVRRGYALPHALFARDLRRIHRRRLRPGMEEEVAGFGCCVPGGEHLLVTADGRLETCEKTDGCSLLRLGDLETGVDPDRPPALLRVFAELSGERCTRCFNLRLCNACFAHAVHAGRLDRRKLAWHCDLLRRRTREMLALYCEVLEEDAGALDFL